LHNHNIDITKNIRTIEILKSNLLSEVAFLYEIMAHAKIADEEKEETISNIIALSYILAHKLSINHNTLEKKVNAKLTKGGDQ